MRLRLLAAIGFLLVIVNLPIFVGQGRAAVTISFYSHKLRLVDGFSTDFPHGFVLLSGKTDSGEPVSANLGFSAVNIFINVLWEPVRGGLDPMPLPDSYVAEAWRHFSFPLSDAQYRAVMVAANKWRTAPQPSYDIDTRNCVIFVKELAVAAGLSVSDDVKFIHAPGDFLEDVAARNADFLARNGERGTARPPGAQSQDDMSALQKRVQQLEKDAAGKAN